MPLLILGAGLIVLAWALSDHPSVGHRTPALLGGLGAVIVAAVLWALVGPVVGIARELTGGVEWVRPGQPLRF